MKFFCSFSIKFERQLFHGQSFSANYVPYWFGQPQVAQLRIFLWKIICATSLVCFRQTTAEFFEKIISVAPLFRSLSVGILQKDRDRESKRAHLMPSTQHYFNPPRHSRYISKVLPNLPCPFFALIQISHFLQFCFYGKTFTVRDIFTRLSPLEVHSKSPHFRSVAESCRWPLN